MGLPLRDLGFFLLNQLIDQLLLINLVLLHLTSLVTFHDEDRLMIPVFNKLIFDALEHHVKPVFDIILRSTRHILNNLRPLVAY